MLKEEFVLLKHLGEIFEFGIELSLELPKTGLLRLIDWLFVSLFTGFEELPHRDDLYY